MADINPDLPQRGRIAGTEHRFPVRIYFEDTDLSGIVYHANYLRYMERARSDMLAVSGIDQRATMEAGDGYYAVADLHIKYVAPAKLDDALLVISTVEEIRAASIRIHQRVMRGSEVIADATVLAAFLGPNGRPTRQPRRWIEIYETLKTGQ